MNKKKIEIVVDLIKSIKNLYQNRKIRVLSQNTNQQYK